MKTSFIHKLVCSSSKIYFTIYTEYIARGWSDQSLAYCRHAMDILLNNRGEETTSPEKRLCKTLIMHKEPNPSLQDTGTGRQSHKLQGAEGERPSPTPPAHAVPKPSLSFLHLLPSKVICCCPVDSWPVYPTFHWVPPLRSPVDTSNPSGKI